MTIQEYLATKLREASERKKLRVIARLTGIRGSQLSRLARHNNASIKTCEALIEYFNEDVAQRFAQFATVKAVEKIVMNDDTLTQFEQKFLVDSFRYNHKFLERSRTTSQAEEWNDQGHREN